MFRFYLNILSLSLSLFRRKLTDFQAVAGGNTTYKKKQGEHYNVRNCIKYHHFFIIYEN